MENRKEVRTLCKCLNDMHIISVLAAGGMPILSLSACVRLF